MRQRRILPALSVALLAMLALAGLACRGSSGEVTPRSSATATSSVPIPIATSGRAADEPQRDLSTDEERGGHTLARHVGRTDDELHARLAREQRISAASTYTDRQTAERVIARTLVRERSRIDRWTSREGRRPNLALDYDGRDSEVIGRSIRRGEDSSVPCHAAVVVLKWDEGRADYYVLTSYPEVRR